MKKLPTIGKRRTALALVVCTLCSCAPAEHALILRHGECLPEPPNGAISSQTPYRQEIRAVPRGRRLRGTWKNPQLLRAGGVRRVRIHLASQRGELLVNGQIAMEFPVSTGKRNSTPEGTYHILEKDRRHRSNLYNVAMPYFMRLTYDGIGLHVGDVYPYPVSHGCIRMTREACIPLYELLPLGTEVTISRS